MHQSATSKDLYLTLDRLLAVVVFLGGILLSLILTRSAPVRLRDFSLAITMFIEVLLLLSASLLLRAGGNQELFIVCMCLAPVFENCALDKTNGFSVHSTYMTGMVTALMRKSFDHLFSNRSSKENASSDSARLTFQVPVSTWMSYIFGAVNDL